MKDNLKDFFKHDEIVELLIRDLVIDLIEQEIIPINALLGGDDEELVGGDGVSLEGGS
jgi:hypothetical protein